MRVCLIKKKEVRPDNLHVKFQISPNEAACLQDTEATELLPSIPVFTGQYCLYPSTGSANLLDICIEESSKSSKITVFVTNF